MFIQMIERRHGVANIDITPSQLFFPAIVVAGLVATVSVFWIGINALAISWQSPEYSHGPLIPIISLFLFLRQMRRTKIDEAAINDRWPGVALAVAALAIAILANIAKIPDIASYALILWVGALTLIRFGWRQGLQFWPPVVHLVFMLSLPAFIFWKITTTLQLWSSEIGVFLIQLMGVSVYLDGNIIDLGVYKLHVAEACSGLRYLFPILSFSYIFAVLYKGPMWHKAVLLLSAAPITVLMNSVRIAIVGVLVDNYGIEHAEGFMHFFEGWVIFCSCVAILFGLAVLMQRFQAEPKPLSEALDLDATGLRDEAKRLGGNVRSSAMIATMAIFVSAATIWHAAPPRTLADVDRAPLVLFPKSLGDWEAGRSRVLPLEIAEVLEADEYRAATYDRAGENAPVDFFVAYYGDLASSYGIHSPEICIPAGGWEMSTITQKIVDAPDGQGSFAVNRAVIQHGLNRQLVYFWFEQRGRRLTSDVVAKAYTVLDSIVRGRSDGALVRLITPIDVNETDADAEARIQRMMNETLRELPRFIPS